MEWPDLDNYGFVAGRTATEQDLMKGNAAFLLKSGDAPLSTPLDMELPQYALHIDKNDNNETPGVIIQAEKTNDGQDLIGFIPLDSQAPITSSLNEFRLLGKNKPPAIK